MDKTFQILLKLLKSFNYNLPEQEVKERLFSDPNKGVTSITNTLDYFDIKNLVANVPKEAFNQLPNSFIAQVGNHKQSSLVLINKIDEKSVRISADKEQPISMSIDEFLMNWTGLIIAIEKNENRNPKNLKKLLLNTVPLLVALLLVLIIVFTTNSILKSVYFVLSLIGVCVSFLIIKEKLSSDNSSSKFCKISENTDCQSVLNSKEAKLFNTVDLSDISVVYFSFITLSFIFNPSVIIFKALSILSLPLIFYSIYYQYFKIKKWCPLCLVLASVLLLQFVVLMLIPNESIFNFLVFLPLPLFLFLIIISWIKTKRLLTDSFENKKLRIENLTFRRNHKLFLPYYNSLRELDLNLPSGIEIKLGSENPLVTIILVTNPLCKMCKEAHNVYVSLLNKYPNELQINAKF